MLTILFISWLLSNLLPPATAADGGIRGRLSITRTLTKRRVVLPVQPMRGLAPERLPEDGAIDEWARVVVYLEGEGAPEPVPVEAALDQTGQRFVPDTVVVPVGSTVWFPNSDPIFHNVFSLSRARAFDLGHYPAGETRKVTFDRPGVVQVFCHLHPNMSAAVVVAPNGWYARPDNAGTFSFPGLPAGTYQVVVWHKSAGFFRKEVRVPAGGVVDVSIEIPLEVAAGGR